MHAILNSSIVCDGTPEQDRHFVSKPTGPALTAKSWEFNALRVDVSSAWSLQFLNAGRYVVAVRPELKETPRGNPVFISGLIERALNSEPTVLKLYGDVVCIYAVLSFFPLPSSYISSRSTSS